MVYYSALHWAKKAEKSAENSAKSEENVQNFAQEIETSKNEGLSAINSAKDEAINDILLQTNTFSRNIGEIVQSTIPLTDAGLHLLDGSIIFGDGIYVDFVNYIKNLANNYQNLFVDELTWQNTVNNKGVCGKFVYDSTNNTVRLPKITGFIEGTVNSNALGELINAGLPNITGSATSGGNPGAGGSYWNQKSGAFHNLSSSGSSARWTTYNNTNDDASFTLGFDASKSNSIYGKSNTVQPQAIKVFYYIVIATLTKTDIEINTDNIITELNNKINNQDAVHKTGDEIGGALVFNGSKNLGFKNSEMDVNNLPASNKYIEIPFKDKNGVEIAEVVATLYPNGARQLDLQARNIENQRFGSIGAVLNADGSVYGKAPASSIIGSILTTQGINKAANGYVKLGNGIIIQWGQSSTGVAITLPTPFTSTNYKVVSTGSGYNKYGPGYSYEYTTTSFKLGGDNTSRPWIAIGY